MRHELLFEIGTEEIPAGYLLPATDRLQAILSAKLKAAALDHAEPRAAATPRRLVVWVDGLAERQADRVEEIIGPPKSAAFDPSGKPTKVAEGFARSRGVGVGDLQVAATPKGEYLMVRKSVTGEATRDVLSRILPEVVAEIPFPKSMRWGTSRLSFARPIQWILALFGGEVVPFTLDGVGPSGAVTYGHRFMAPAAIPVTGFAQYQDALSRAHVTVDPEERKRAVDAEIRRAAATVGGAVLDDPELVATVANLIEEPHAICGTFDRRFLDLPKEALITSMREHQKTFAVVDATGNLLPHFIAVNNTMVKDDVLAAEGHQRVLRARLEDGLFFFREDQHRTLADRVPQLGGIVFQAKLGTMLEKTERIAALAARLANRLAPAEAATATRAAHLAKADLLTAMVNEFPSLQGLMGRDYAVRNGETPAVAQAIAEHYMPIRSGSELPASVAGAIVSIADRADTLAGCFGIGQMPTGTTDPFGLRRAALGLIHVISAKGFTLSLSDLFRDALDLYGAKLTVPTDTALATVLDFVKGRFANDRTAAGIPTGTVDAVLSVRFDDLRDCAQRIDALTRITDQPSFPLLAGSFKRVMNIIKDHADTEVRADLLREPSEQALFAALQQVRQEAQPLIDRQAYLPALEAILKMKEPVDRFFEDVMVMADDPEVRRNRLSLLAGIAALFLQVGDFSRMYTLAA